MVAVVQRGRRRSSWRPWSARSSRRAPASLHAIDATRGHLTSMRVVSFLILSTQVVGEERARFDKERSRLEKELRKVLLRRLRFLTAAPSTRRARPRTRHAIDAGLLDGATIATRAPPAGEEGLEGLRATTSYPSTGPFSTCNRWKLKTRKLVLVSVQRKWRRECHRSNTHNAQAICIPKKNVFCFRLLPELGTRILHCL